MTPLRDSLDAWAAAARERLRGLSPAPTLDHVGTVAHVGDGVATVVGLPWVRADETLQFENGALGLALHVEENAVGCVLLGGGAVAAGSRVRGTGGIVRVPVGETLLGRVVDGTGQPLDDGAPLASARHDPIERPAPAIVDRAAVTQPLMTGLTAVDAMIPLGRGQRELIIGDRKTGKTAIAVDTIISQRDSDVICVYAAIGQKASTVHQVVEAVRAHGAIERCIFVVGEAAAVPGAQWITQIGRASCRERV